MMIDKLKQTAMREGMKLLSNPKVMKLMADPRFMNYIMKGMELRGRIQSSVDSKLRLVATMLNLATKEELANIQRNLRQVEARFGDLRRKVDDGPNVAN